MISHLAEARLDRKQPKQKLHNRQCWGSGGVGSGQPHVSSLPPDLLLWDTQTPLVTGHISFSEMYP